MIDSAFSLQIWLTAQKGKGLEVSGTFVHRQGQIVMEMEFANRSLQPMNDFALQINRNSFGLAPVQPLFVTSPLFPNQTTATQLVLSTSGPVLKIDPLTNVQVAIKNNIDILYFTCVVPIHVFFVETAPIDKMAFMQMWQDIPSSNEFKHQLANTKNFSVDELQSRLKVNHIRTSNRTAIDQHEMLFQLIKLTNGIVILVELKMAPGNRTIAVRVSLSV